jgi:hypothetical protein
MNRDGQHKSPTVAVKIGSFPRYRSVEPGTVELGTLTPPIDRLANLYRIVQDIGMQAIYDLVYLVLAIEDEAVNEEKQLQIGFRLEFIYNTLGSVFSSPEDMLLNFSYALLQTRQITREYAASMASRALGREMSTTAWRKRVDRYAEAQGLPPLGQTKRRPRKQVSGQSGHN